MRTSAKLSVNLSAAGFESADEVDVPIALDVVGTLPRWLQGRLVHTGPALYELPRGSYEHWFDGLAQLGVIAFGAGGVTYRSRFLRSEAYCSAQDKGRPILGEFGTRPRGGALRDAVAHLLPPHPTDNANVNVVDLGGRVIAMTESARHVEFDPVTLETRGELVYDDELEGQLSTAHPCIDHARDALYNLLIRFGRTSAIQVYEQPRHTVRRRLVASIETPRPSYTHSFTATEHFIVLTQTPMVVNPLKLRFSTKPYFDRYDWQPELGTRITVLRKDDGRVQASAVAPPQFVFHHVNAFERDAADGWIDVDLIAYPDPSSVATLRLASLRQGGATTTGRLVRYSLRDDGLDQTIAPVALIAEPLELPSVHPRCAQGPHRFVYGVGNVDPRDHNDRIMKVDLETRTHRTFARDATYFNEPRFVPAPAGTTEDAGVLLVIAFDARATTGRLIVLDAKALDVVAEAALPQVVPFYFHGEWL
jgi:beta,beta-carotene 9',10'-dioxygenase